VAFSPFLSLPRSTPIPGFLDDYTFVVCGLLDLYEATLQTEWLSWAEELQLRQDALFWDAQGGGYYCSQPSDPTMLLQLKQGECRGWRDGWMDGWMDGRCINAIHLTIYMRSVSSMDRLVGWT